MKVLRRFNPFWIKLPLSGINSLIDRASRVISPLLSRTAVLIGFAVIVAAVVVLAARWSEFSASSSALYLPGNWFGILVAWIVLKFVHELAHAAACHRLGGEVRESGLVLILFAPLAYVDVSSCWRMNSRLSRMAVAAAGMYVEVLIAAIAVFCWISVESISARFMLFQIIVTAGVSTLWFNANVLMRFDGYFILADLIDVPNLHREGSESVKRLMTRIVTGKRSQSPSLGTWRQPCVLIYGFAALAWRFVVCVTLCMAASTMFKGAGIAIAALGLVFWLASPLRMIVQAAEALRSEGWMGSIRPITVSAGLGILSAWLLFLCPIPTSISAPAIVQFVPETVVRSQASGFVTQIHVTDGQVVAEGQPLMVLENRELAGRLAAMELTRQQNEIRLRQATETHDSSLQQVIRQDQLALDQQIEPLRKQVAELKVVSPRSGRVIARMLKHRLGDYAEEGESMLVVAGERDKEVVAVIGQDVVDETRQYLGEEVRIFTAGFEEVSGQLTRIEPRATDRLPAPALAATDGGPLGVRASENDGQSETMRMIDPAFRGRITLVSEKSLAIPAGTRVTASLGFRLEPLGSRWMNTIRELWFQAKQAQ
jgi:putative peptide zinc metalloprotease protein